MWHMNHLFYFFRHCSLYAVRELEAKGDKKPRACSARFQADTLRAQHMILVGLAASINFVMC